VRRPLDGIGWDGKGLDMDWTGWDGIPLRSLRYIGNADSLNQREVLYLDSHGVDESKARPDLIRLTYNLDNTIVERLSAERSNFRFQEAEKPESHVPKVHKTVESDIVTIRHIRMKGITR
jgi:hypothetical protein